ncbi:hypothetical protein HK100_003609 [Physocladia obscura]|uniref:Cyclic nucleotide-binding domain-containing protein n=1 Tax=Physocladia obscura TaxID=109957 RepID=A0AAD5SVD6_9FUNG|nr:hypothetical protein HK100_003609 [Physocladia obscura]
MNESLRMEIAAQNCRELISKVPFLRREQNDGRDELFTGRIAGALLPCYYVAGDVLFVQGEIGGDMVLKKVFYLNPNLKKDEKYFCLTGKLHVLIGGKRVTVLRDGAFFGEIALIANIPRTATVQAASSCMLYKLTRLDFENIASTFEDVKKKVEDIYNERMNKIRLDEEARKLTVAKDISTKISFLQRTEGDDRDKQWVLKLSDIMTAEFYTANQEILRQGEQGDAMFILQSGNAEDLFDGQKISLLQPGAYFGELSLVNISIYTSTVKAVTACMCYKISKQSFYEILEEFEEMNARIQTLLG